MSTKTENVKNFINQIGKENQLFLFVGTNSTETKANSPKSEIDIWKDSDFSVKIGKDNAIGVAPNVKWIKKRSYKPWSSTDKNTENYYVYNQDNGYVYLCLSDNLENRLDLEGQNVSNYIPSHSSGYYTYQDGYTWKALYKITPYLEKFVTESCIPVVSFDNFENIDKTSLFTQMVNYCYTLETKSSGYCSLYYSKNYQYLDGNGNPVNAVKGNLHFTTTVFACHECYNTFKDHPNFISVFSSTPASTIQIKDTYDVVADMISTNKIPITSPYYYLYKVNEGSPDEGYVVSAKINLASFSLENLSISKDNPELTVYSNSGSGARIRLTTYISITNKIIVNGIEIISRGSGYKDIQLELKSADMLGSVTNASLVSAIKIDLDEIDGLGFDPMKVLNVDHIMIDVVLDKTALNTSNLATPSSINFYGLVQNPKYGTGFEYTAGTNENKYLSTLYRTTVKISAYTPVTKPVKNKTATITETNGKVLRDIKVAAVSATLLGYEEIGESPPAVSYLELKGLDYTEAASLSGTTTTNNYTYNIKDVEILPSFVQYTGKVLSTNKTTSINIENEDTAIIRINMVKGM